MSCGRISEQHVGVLEGPHLGLGVQFQRREVLECWEGGRAWLRVPREAASRTLVGLGRVSEQGVGVGVASGWGDSLSCGLPGPPKGGVALDLRLALLVHGAVMPFCGPGLGADLCPGLLGGPLLSPWQWCQEGLLRPSGLLGQ